MSLHTAHRLRTILGLSLILILLLTPAAVLAQDTGTGFYYVVRPGDTWTGIAHTVGVPVSTIKQYNPKAIHPNDYLWIGDRLWIPAPEPTHATAGYWYSVKQGNDWNYVSKVTGAPVSVLKAANPIAAADPHGWLYIGQKLWIPTGPPAAPEASTKAAAPTGAAEGAGATVVIPVPETTSEPSAVLSGAAAATQTRIASARTSATAAAGASTPGASPTEAPAMAVVGTPTPRTGPEATPEPLFPMEPTAAATSAEADSPTAAATPAKSGSPTGAATPAEVASPTAAAGVTAEAQPSPQGTPGAASETTGPGIGTGCPADPAAFPEAIAMQLNQSDGDVEALKAWLQTCKIFREDSGDVAKIGAPGAAAIDVAVVLPSSPAAEPAQDQLLVYDDTTGGYTLSHQVEGAGKIELLKIEDINADGKLDLVYSDTSCGAQTCFSTLFVESWNGSEWQDWIKGKPTMAGAEYSFEDTVPAGQGTEILAYGGVINSPGAGPQRAWTETYISPEGAPYEFYKKVYDESPCLYHQTLDANERFDNWTEAGFAPAISSYDKAIADEAAEPCGDDPDEMTQLSDFSRFRLVVSWVSRGRMDKAAKAQSEMTYKPLIGAADTFLASLKKSHSIVQACRDTTRYAEANPDSWDYLSDWGYANPTFTPADLCPLG